MKRNGPLITLLVGIGVAAVLFVLSMQATRINAASGPASPVAGLRATAQAREPVGGATVPDDALGPAAPATEGLNADAGQAPNPDQPPPDQPLDQQPLAQRVTPDGTWAGPLKAGTLALSIKDGKAIAYLCDGKKIEGWFKGSTANGSLDLKGKNSSVLTGTVDQSHAKGKVTVGTRTWAFDVEAVKKPSGLWRAVSNVRGAKLVGGWIVLKNGRQVGLATVGDRQTVPSAIDPATGTATIAGTTVTAAPADPTQ
jgi:hypothetical protein